MTEATAEILTSPVQKSTIEQSPTIRPNGHALEDLARRSHERVEHTTQPGNRESAVALPKTLPKKAEVTVPSLTQTTMEAAPKRTWWRNLISKPIRMPRFIIEAVIDDYHKAFPYVFDDHPIRPTVTYEHSLYFPPFNVIDVKVPNDSFSKKYPLFNEFITQEVSELAADKRRFIGPLLGLAARITGATSYRLLYFRAFGRWKNVERALDRTYGKEERKRLVHRAYFLEGDELTNLEEKAKEAGCPIDEAYRSTRETKGSMADDSFWRKIPGKWKDVVLRIAAGAVAHVGKVTDVTLLTVIALVDLNALYLGLVTLARNLPLLSTITATHFPAFLGFNLAFMGATAVGVMYHEMGHQMTKTLLELNKTN